MLPQARAVLACCVPAMERDSGSAVTDTLLDWTGQDRTAGEINQFRATQESS